MTLLRVLTISSLLVTASFSMAQSLKIGDKAPEFKVDGWLKGSPQTLGNGNITVVEFWATWCLPCRNAIPHLSLLAKKYKGKVNFVGVNVHESNPKDYKTKSPALVKEFGDKMDYNVAFDSTGKMWDNWIEAAQCNGIPSTFLIDAGGKIAWIGHPDDLNNVIERLLDGKLDIEEEKKKRYGKKMSPEELTVWKNAEERIEKVIKAIRDKKYQEANDLTEKVLMDFPQYAKSYYSFKLGAMSRGKLPGLDTYIDSLAKEKFMNSPEEKSYALTIILNEGHTSSVYKSSFKLAEKMMEQAPNNARCMQAYALAAWYSGDKEKALATQKRAVDSLKQSNVSTPEDINEAIAQLKQFGG